MILSNYCNQSISYKIRQSTKSEYNIYDYTEITLTCRIVYKKELFRNKNDEELLSKAIIYSETILTEGDQAQLDDIWHSVEKVYKYVDLDGNIIGYKAILI